MKMSLCYRILKDEFLQTQRNPGRFRHVFNLRRIREKLSFYRLRDITDVSWDRKQDSPLLNRQDIDYDDYVKVQASKLQYLDLQGHEQRFRKVLAERLRELPFVTPGATAVCLGARLGSEVQAFIDCSCFAVGIDLNPGEENRLVLHGDFHNLQFADSSVDMMFTNSLDHAYDMTNVISEVLRVLKPGGRLIVEADPGSEESQVAPDLWAWTEWKAVDDLVAAVESHGLQLASRADFDYPRGGEQLVFAINHQANSQSAESRTDCVTV